MKVMKFGGTSVGKPQRMHEVAKLITSDAEPKIVVLSAVSGTTNALVEIGNALSTGDKEAAKKKELMPWRRIISSLSANS